ncbi:amino acid ABC transporter substrate-binding protein [Bacteriovorax stolpii]|uniref:Amino acid ABC transporter substrate-binding protein n=1 Tax=Bacteriovorax stolpii TaxID=960 RepID=A0A2K9NW70_BACTC|nr:transporter substrate-binding domain-containing protein [Bacteriovorax stolpii]AUN99773.1 amino acid ABC transporter substrate-binding protein [Bacteriovorax stolpii]TDP54340.1 amino acid ABC transporter substrate-binding protein (PAAT family) [Bacteriovorax stolpii]
MKKFLFLLLPLTCAFFYSALLQAEDQKVLTVGFGMNKPPYVFEKEDSGFEVEIFREAAHAAGYEVKSFFGPLERLKSKLLNGQLDAITITNMNENLHSYNSVPFIIYHNYAIALKKKNLKIKTIADLKNYSVTSFQRSRDLLGSEFAKMSSENPQYREFADQKLRNIQLYKGRADVAIGDIRIFEYFNSQIEDIVDTTQPVDLFKLFKENHYQAAFRSESVMKKFNEGLVVIKKNGTYEKIEKKYSNYKKSKEFPSKKMLDSHMKNKAFIAKAF